jgi:hypothetical protein
MDETNKITDADLKKAIHEEVALFLKENREIILKRALARLKETQREENAKRVSP